VIVTDSVGAYLERSRMPPDPVLAEMEAHAARDRIPIVVSPTGQLLRVLALASRARRALEVGTAIGVSTLYIARGLAPGGSIVSFEVDPERHHAARRYPARAGVGAEPARGIGDVAVDGGEVGDGGVLVVLDGTACAWRSSP